MDGLLGKMKLGDNCVDAIFTHLGPGRFEFTVFSHTDITAYLVDLFEPVPVCIDGEKMDALIRSVTNYGPSDFGIVYQGEITCHA